MRKTVGVICEYDPFHSGHARHFALIRERLPKCAIVCVMSGCFTQRGAPALYAPAFRAKQALLAGADAVLELPTLFALRDANGFASGGISLLHQLGCVTHVSFGCEDADLEALWEAAALLENQDGEFSAQLRARLREGSSYAAAQGAALSLRLGGANRVFEKPNNILAVCYLRALRRLNSPIQPLPVPRLGAYHAQTLEDSPYPSATAIRKAILSGDLEAAGAACGYDPPAAPLCRPEALDSVLLARLRQMNRADFLRLPGCAEGLEYLLYRAARAATDRASLLAMLKSRRYTHARLSRLLAYALLGITRETQEASPAPDYTRLLGFRRESEALLTAFAKGGLLLIAKASQGPRAHPGYELDMAAYDLWALGVKRPAGLMLRQPVQIV